MSLENGRINGYSLTMLTTGFVLGSSLLLIPGRSAGHDAWIAILLGLAEGLLLSRIYSALAERFPGKTLVEIGDLVYGKYLGRLISIAFLWFLLHTGAMSLTNFTLYFSTLLMPKTPPVVLSLLLILVCCSAAAKGIEVLARCSELLTPLMIAIIILDSLILIGNYHLKHLLPVLETPLPQLLHAAHSAASFPFAEAVSFLMVMAFLNENESKKSSFHLLKGISAAGLMLALVAARNTSILGATEKEFVFPSYQVITLINIADITRLEALASAGSLMMGFLKAATLLYGASLGTAQLFGLRRYQPVALPLGILMVLIGMQSFPNTSDMLEFAEKFYPIYAIPFQIAIPLLTLLLARARRLPQEEG